MRVHLLYDYFLFAYNKYTLGMNSLERKGSAWRSQRRRLQFIDFRLRWDGKLRRADLRSTFAISTPQASLDIAQYMSDHPGNMTYDRSLRVYLATPNFRAAYSSSGAPQYLTQLFALHAGIVADEESVLAYRPPVSTVALPTRTTDAAVLRQVLRAIENREALDQDYQSITRDEPQRRSIAPHAFGFDGMRWHVRAYCGLRKGFRDFVLGRILKLHGSGPTTIDPSSDIEWHTMVTLTLVPHPELSPPLRTGIEIDYGMVRGRTTLDCRRAMLFYVMRSLGLQETGEPLPGVRQVLIANLGQIGKFPVLGQP
jgi:hypothetical protein